MNLIVEKIKQNIPIWNTRQLTETDFYNFCETHDILVVETPLRYQVKAMLWFVENEYVATINSRLHGVTKLFAMWHEVGHFILHSPNKTIGTYFWGDERIYSHQNRREENEADVFGLCASVPKDWVLTKTYDELLEEGFSEGQLQKRKEIYEKYKI